jgi:heme-degrading monooxygenase HmoA
MPAMRFLLFDVHPAAGQRQRYLDTAAALRPELDASGGCLFLDRFEDADRSDWLLSFQIWRDEEALGAWRRNRAHGAAQKAGREEVFEDYRIRVGEVLEEREPGAAKRDRSGGAGGRPVVLVESTRPTFAGAERAARFASLYRPGEFMFVLSPRTDADADRAMDAISAGPGVRRIRLCRVERDYGMRERAEAPQSWPR